VKEPHAPPHQSVDPPTLAAPKGYAHGVVATGRTLHLAGQVGWDAGGHFPAKDLVAQVDRALENLLTVVREAGGTPGHVVALRIYVRSVDAWRAKTKEIGAVWRARMGKWFPAMALVEVSRLYEPEALVEIEGTAVLT
jgi:enamine deaminase RidA (YjgF/YER057c/UK114 family)